LSGAASFEGKVAVVTGVGTLGQLGETVARRFAELGARVALLGRGGEVHRRAEELRGSGASVVSIACDLTDPEATSRAAGEVQAFAGNSLHALICLAGGFAMSGPIADSDPSVWQQQISINLSTAYNTTRAFLPLIRAGQGSIVYFSAAAALPGATVSKMSGYVASKAGVLVLMRAVAQEERASHVRANAVAPTAIRTRANLEAMGSGIAYVERDEVAGCVTWLCSASSAPVNGQVIRLEAAA
jgi:3-oxoacyl-[acyl-carrier protein] reductase